MLLLWRGSYPKPLPILHVEGEALSALNERQMDELEWLMTVMLADDALTLEELWLSKTA